MLPESQLDRFMISYSLNELNENDQMKVLKEFKKNEDKQNIELFDLERLNLQKKKYYNRRYCIKLYFKHIKIY